jgi:hypothetical protein
MDAGKHAWNKVPLLSPLFTFLPRNKQWNSRQILICSMTWRKAWIWSPVANHLQVNCQKFTGIDTVTCVHCWTLSSVFYPAQRFRLPMSAQFMTEMCLWLRRICISWWSWNTTYHIWCCQPVWTQLIRYSCFSDNYRYARVVVNTAQRQKEDSWTMYGCSTGLCSLHVTLNKRFPGHWISCGSPISHISVAFIQATM